MTIDEAFDAAIKLLKKRGSLLNADLFRLVQRDKELFRQLRKRLIAEGFAEDQSGAGLKSTDRVLEQKRDERAAADSKPQNVEISENPLFADLDATEQGQGSLISFSEEDFLPLRSEKPKLAASTTPVSSVPPDHRRPEETPEEFMQPSDQMAGGRTILSRLTDSKLNLCALALLALIITVTSIRWRNSFDAQAVYQEFKQYYDEAKGLRARSVSEPGEWQRSLARARSRVRTIVSGLKDVRTGASAQRPELQELLWAGNDNLSKLLDNPVLGKKDEEKLQSQFEFHMAEAKRLLDGGTRTTPQKLIVPKNVPGEGKPYLGD